MAFRVRGAIKVLLAALAATASAAPAWGSYAVFSFDNVVISWNNLDVVSITGPVISQTSNSVTFANGAQNGKVVGVPIGNLVPHTFISGDFSYDVSLDPGIYDPVTGNALRCDSVFLEGAVQAGSETNETLHPFAYPCNIDVVNHISGHNSFNFGGIGLSAAFVSEIDANFVNSPIPEPGTYALVLGGLAALGAARRRRSHIEASSGDRLRYAAN